MNEKKTIIVVLGMHRSGTSVIARSLQVLGVNLGNRLIQAVREENDKGFWEDLDIISLNEEMLVALGMNWHFLTPVQASDIEKLHQCGYLSRATKLMENKTCEYPIFGFKDPRVAKLLMFWKEVFKEMGVSVSYVLAIRNPLSVSKSLSKRNGFDAEKNYLLWLDHVLSSLIGTTGEKKVIVDYDCFLQKPQTELEKLSKSLNLIIDSSELDSFRVNFLDIQLRHTYYLADDLIADTVPPLVREIYTEVLEAVKSPKKLESKTFQQKIEQWNIEFLKMRTALILVDKMTAVIDAMTQKEQTLVKQAIEKEQSLNAQIEYLETQLSHVFASRSWRITAPIRLLCNKIRNLKRR